MKLLLAAFFVFGSFVLDANPDSTGIYSLVDSDPEYYGGEQAMSRYISEHLKYPEKARMQGIEGLVYISFVINRDGTISEVRTFKGVHPLLNMEALRVIAKMPRWKPAFYKGKAVRTRMKIPIRFVLGDDYTQKVSKEEEKREFAEFETLFNVVSVQLVGVILLALFILGYLAYHKKFR